MSKDFDEKKARETILYIKDKEPNADLYAICKLLYLIDQLSLKKYGRFIFGESYYAMKEGGVPSQTYELLKNARVFNYYEFKVKKNTVKVFQKPDIKYLSQSDIECLDQILEQYKDVHKTDQGKKLRKKAHDKVWEQNWNKRGGKKSVPIPIQEIANSLDSSGDLADYLNYS